MTHTCHATGCSVAVPPRMFMCRQHWFRLPTRLRDAVKEHYVPGQEVRKDPSWAYLRAANEAIEWLVRQDRVKDERQRELFPSGQESFLSVLNG